MSRLGKTLVSVGSLLIVAVVGILIYCYWPAITGTVNNNKYYTQEDVQKAYDDGFSDGNKSETELNAKYEYYKTLVDDYYIQVTTLNEEITKLSSENASYSSQVKNLTTHKNNLQSQVDNLNTIKANNETTIADLNNQISSLQSQITNLTNSGEDKSEQIANLNAQVSNLQKTVNQLQKTNQMNLETITSLNTQIASLNSQISELTENSQNYTGKINALNNKIAELQKSITYYETYISQLESNEQVVATFEFDGSVYNIQIVNKGSKLAVATPTSTTYKIFNGWTVNGQSIDLNTYTISANTKIIADITYKYDVKFKVDDEIISSQIITKNACATLPTNPTKSGYEFDGWSINGVDIISNISSKQVTQNTTYIAVFTKLHTVTFVYENETKSTQSIRNGNFASSIDVVNTQYKVFNGWTVDDTIIDLSNYKIMSDTIFVASITYKYRVDFVVDLSTDESKTNYSIYNTQTITKNDFATVPANPVKNGYVFDGWSIDKINIVTDINSMPVTEKTAYFAVFTKAYTVKFCSEGEIINTQLVREGDYVVLPTNPEKENHEFDGWSLNYVDVIKDIKSLKISKKTTFYAVFTRVFNINYYVGDSIISQQKIRYGSTDYTLQIPKITLANGDAVYWYTEKIDSYGLIVDTTNNPFDQYIDKSSSKPTIIYDMNFYAYSIDSSYDFYGTYTLTYNNCSCEVLINKDDISNLYFRNSTSFGLRSTLSYNKGAVDYEYNITKSINSVAFTFLIGKLNWSNGKYTFSWKVYERENPSNYAVGSGELTQNSNFKTIKYIACDYTINGWETFV